jgi:hypothetical protein
MSTTPNHTPVQFNLSSGRRIRLTLEEWRELRMLIAESTVAPPKLAALPVQRIAPDLSKVK